MHKGIKGRVVGLSIAAAMIATTTAMQADTTAPRVWDQCKVTTTDSIPIRSGSQDSRTTPASRTATTWRSRCACCWRVIWLAIRLEYWMSLCRLSTSQMLLGTARAHFCSACETST